MRVSPYVIMAQSDQRQQLASAKMSFATGCQSVGDHRLTQHVTNSHPRIQALIRVLEHHLHATTNSSALSAFDCMYVLTFEFDRSLTELN
jgi:hypothetical protein